VTIAFALVIALVAVLIVLEPLLRAASGRPVAAPAPFFSDSDDEDDPRLVRRDRALAALKEIEFDRETGKLSDDDFARMKTQFTAEALEALRAADAAAAGGAAVSDEAIERLIASARAPSSAKQRFCMECGMPIEGQGKFCLECGAPVAAGA
jgi:hypothetical protein